MRSAASSTGDHCGTGSATNALATMQVLAEYFSACGDVVAVRLGEKTVPQQLTIKAWIEFRSQHAARTAKEYDQTVRRAL